MTQEQELQHLEVERDQLDDLQYSLKILMNASYGSLALAGNSFSNGPAGMSNSITTQGRMFNRVMSFYVSRYINEYLGSPYSHEELLTSPYTVQADTDSIYVTLGNVVDTLIDSNKLGDLEERKAIAQKFYEEHLITVIQNSINDVNRVINSYEPEVLVAEQEVNASYLISVAPKRYFLRNSFKEYKGKVVILEESKAKLKVTGLNVIGKSTCNFAKTHLKKIMTAIMYEDIQEVSLIVQGLKDAFYEAPIKDIVQVKGVNKISYNIYEEDTGKFKRESDKCTLCEQKVTFKEGKCSSCGGFGKPVKLNTVGGHGAGALHYNMYIAKNKIVDFNLIGAGDKVKYFYLIDNPKVQSKYLSFIDPRFVEIEGFLPYIDYELTFQKHVIKPVEIILDALDEVLRDPSQNLEDMWG